MIRTFAQIQLPSGGYYLYERECGQWTRRNRTHGVLTDMAVGRILSRVNAPVQILKGASDDGSIPLQLAPRAVPS